MKQQFGVCYRKDKFGSESECGILVGYEGADGYRIYVNGRRDLVRSCNVTFESESTYKAYALEINSLTDRTDEGKNENVVNL